MALNAELGQQIANAVEVEDVAVAVSAIRGGDFIVFQQIDPESGDLEETDDGDFCVVTAEVDEETAVLCFSDQEAAEYFAGEMVSEEIPEGHSLPAVVLDGVTLLDGLPEDCGLLVNAGAETECYFPPGSFD